MTAARPSRSGPRAGADYPSSLSQFLDWFQTDADCAAYLARLRWPDGFSCPNCGPSDAWLTKRQARMLAPWTDSPYVQLALVQEAGGKLRQAKVSIGRAIDHENGDWRLWLISARISAKLGDISAARASLDRGRELNPRSSVFAP